VIGFDVRVREREKDRAMLPHFFFEWWFAPWDYAGDAPGRLPLPADRLAQRDGYRLWCEQARVPADLPAEFDPAWQVAATGDGNELIATARLFAGLLAAREHDQQALGALAFADRKWCISIAATQPLRSAGELPYAAEDGIELRGLVELARRLEQGFPGMWPRLRLMLPPAPASRTEALLEAVLPAPETSAVRAQRCWTLCRNRAASVVADEDSSGERVDDAVTMS
jgi:hypothetical protein